MPPSSSLTLVEAAAELGLADSTLRHQVRNGRLKAEKRGGSWWITRRELERYRAATTKPDEEATP